jgi:hypothetical protein
MEETHTWIRRRCEKSLSSVFLAAHGAARTPGIVNAKFLVVATPAGLEKFFEEVFYPAGDPSVEPPPM